MNYFTFNGTKSSVFGLLVNNVSNFGAPERVVEKIQIPYRSGDLLIDTHSYSNTIVTYDVSLIYNTIANTRAIAEWLLATDGYCVLSDTYNTGETRMAAYYNELEYTMEHLNRYGRATISFDCKPQRFLSSGTSATTLGSSTTLTNPTAMDAQPYIEVTGNGTFTINGYSITITDKSGQTTTIDCESMQCYRGTTNMNGSVTMPDGFPVLGTGANTCGKGTATTVKVTPRWWRL